MRVNEGKPFAVSNILHRHVLKECRLPHAGLSNHIHVAATILRLNAKRNVFATCVSRGKVGYAFIIHCFLQYSTGLPSKRKKKLLLQQAVALYSSSNGGSHPHCGKRAPSVYLFEGAQSIQLFKP